VKLPSIHRFIFFFPPIHPFAQNLGYELRANAFFLRTTTGSAGREAQNKLLLSDTDGDGRRRMMETCGKDRAGAADDGRAGEHRDLSMNNLASDSFQVDVEAELKSVSNLKGSGEGRALPDTETVNQDQENVDPTMCKEAKGRRAMTAGAKGLTAVPKTRSLRRLVISKNSAMAVSALKNWEGASSSEGSDTETESECGCSFGDSFKGNVSTASLQRRGSLSLSPSFRSRSGSQKSQGLSPIQGQIGALLDSAETPPPRWPAKVRDYFGQVPDFESTGDAAGDLSTHRDNVFRSLHAFATSSLRAVSFSSSIIQARRSLQGENAISQPARRLPVTRQSIIFQVPGANSHLPKFDICGGYVFNPSLPVCLLPKFPAIWPWPILLRRRPPSISSSAS
jgi:hypothetical protein